MHKGRMWVINLCLVIAIVVIFAVTFIVGSRKQAPEGEGFGGTDSVATEVVEETGYKPWFTPFFEPSSGEVESGLFAMQAALGGLILGFALGALNQKFRQRKDSASAASSSGTSAP